MSLSRPCSISVRDTQIKKNKFRSQSKQIKSNWKTSIKKGNSWKTYYVSITFTNVLVFNIHILEICAHTIQKNNSKKQFKKTKVCAKTKQQNNKTTQQQKKIKKIKKHFIPERTVLTSQLTLSNTCFFLSLLPANSPKGVHIGQCRSPGEPEPRPEGEPSSEWGQRGMLTIFWLFSVPLTESENERPRPCWSFFL